MMGEFLAVVIWTLLAVLAGCQGGHIDAHTQFRECRTLLATRDSATVLVTKPECRRWTLPVPPERSAR